MQILSIWERFVETSTLEQIVLDILFLRFRSQIHINKKFSKRKIYCFFEIVCELSYPQILTFSRKRKTDDLRQNVMNSSIKKFEL